MSAFVIDCPHCGDKILLHTKEINCAIFRHGVLKSNNEQINPHMGKNECEYLFKNGKIYGCGKPFRLSNWPGSIEKLTAQPCDYI